MKKRCFILFFNTIRYNSSKAKYNGILFQSSTEFLLIYFLSVGRKIKPVISQGCCENYVNLETLLRVGRRGNRKKNCRRTGLKFSGWNTLFASSLLSPSKLKNGEVRQHPFNEAAISCFDMKILEF